MARSVAGRLPTMRPVTESTTTTIQARDGTSILVRDWAPQTEPWADVLLVHGIAEHSGRYEQVGAWLSAIGLHVTGFDQRGFGGSGGRRAFVERWSILHDDLEDRLAAVRAGAEGRPPVPYRDPPGGPNPLRHLRSGTAPPPPESPRL